MSECAALNCTIAAGCKVILTNPVVQRGYFMLMGGSVQVLGGCVQRLEAARQRLLAHWNKPLGCNLLSVQVRLGGTFCCVLQSEYKAFGCVLQHVHWGSTGTGAADFPAADARGGARCMATG